MGRGIAPKTLAEQVAAAVPWALDANLAPSLRVAEARKSDVPTSALSELQYFSLLISAHYLTVASFCPTDVDARIRHHAWVEMPRDDLAEAVRLVDEASQWDALAVSARTVSDKTYGRVSGHDGEWFSVRAGALMRAALQHDDALALHLKTAIEEELVREAHIFDSLVAKDDPLLALSAATVLAHNAGDLSRVVDAWPKKPELSALHALYTRIGHEGPSRFGRAFVRAGAANKKLMAHENHRFLAMRKARSLRRSRALLLPFGPWLDAWGEQVARSLDDNECIEVVTALGENHLRGPEEEGCMRALAGIDRVRKGGVKAMLPHVPVRVRKALERGALPAALRVSEASYLERARVRARAAWKEFA